MAGRAKLELRHYGAVAANHSHGHHQVVLPVEGWMEMTVAGRQQVVSASHAAVIPADRSHKFSVSRENSFLVLDVPVDKVSFGGEAGQHGQDFWAAASIEPFVPLDPAFSHLSSFVAQEVGRYDDHGGLHNLSQPLLEALGRRMGLGPRPEPLRLQRARRFIETHHAQALEVAQIAAAAHVSVSRLHALFQSHYGTSPRRYLIHHRLERAAELLRQTPMPLAQVALAVGYQDQSAFTRAFRRFKGVTPAAFRQPQS